MAVKPVALLQMLGGNSFRLSIKSQAPFHKKRNVPIIVITDLPNRCLAALLMKAYTKEFLVRFKFTSKVAELQEERVIATLYGCILRRLQQKG